MSFQIGLTVSGFCLTALIFLVVAPTPRRVKKSSTIKNPQKDVS
jgi:hypothetical protein